MDRKFLGLALATLFGVLGTIPWIIIGYFGWIASIAGFAIGWAAFKGYEKGNGSIDKFGKISILILIIILVPFAEFINLVLAALAFEIPLLTALSTAPSLFIENIGEFLPGILIGYVMAALGTYSFFMPQRNEQIEEEKLESEDIRN